MEALTVNAGDDDDEGEEGEEEGSEKGEAEPPSCMDYVMHFITVPWKLAFALIPPTGKFMVISYLSGYLLQTTGEDGPVSPYPSP